MMRRRHLLLTALVLALSIISTVFSILTATSPRWAVQNYYLGQIPTTAFTSVLTSANRSPFYRCGIPLVGDDGTYNVPDCTFYPPSGSNRTSCRVDAELGDDYLRTSQLEGTEGSYMECQQVHLAGNLQIAASTFTGLGLLVSFAFGVTVFLSKPHQRDEGATAGESRKSEHHAGRGDRHHSRRARALAFMTAILILFLLLGAALQVLAQFFGVLGLTQNATPNANLITQRYLSGFGNFSAGDWILDIALVRYASVAWLSAVLCAVGAGWLFWRTRMALYHA